jgi:hypothetical protein
MIAMNILCNVIYMSSLFAAGRDNGTEGQKPRENKGFSLSSGSFLVLDSWASAAGHGTDGDQKHRSQHQQRFRHVTIVNQGEKRKAEYVASTLDGKQTLHR